MEVEQSRGQEQQPYKLDPALEARARWILHTKSERVGKDWWDSPEKRIFERSIALVAVANPFYWTLMSLVGLTIIANDRKWPIVKLNRSYLVPEHSFRIFKFLTMNVGPEFEEPLDKHQAKINGTDPRFTRIGPWLRRRSLDELPQVINVLRGEMALIGPRPITEENVKEHLGPSKEGYPYSDFKELLRGGIRYGLLSLAGILGRRDLSWEDGFAVEAIYGEQASFIGDLNIIAHAPEAVLSMRGAY